MKGRRASILLTGCFMFVCVMYGCGGGGGGSNPSPANITDASVNSVAKTLCGDTAFQYVNTAKNSIFKSTVTEQDFDAARSSVASALSSNSNCPDANLLSAVMDIMEEADRVFSDVLENEQSLFPVEYGRIAGGPLSRAVNPILNNLPRHASKLGENSTPSEYQTEISNSLPVLESALVKLDKVRGVIYSQTSWGFTFPKNPSKPQLGYESIDKYDVELLKGAIQLVVGLMHYSIAYNLDCPDTFPECSNHFLKDLYLDKAADADSNNVLTPEEYFPPVPFGTLKSGGASNLNKAKTNISAGLETLYIAIDSITKETEVSVGGMSVASALLQDVTYYKHYIHDLAKSFGGTTTDIVIPKIVDCWTYYGPWQIYNPDYRTDKVKECTEIFTIYEEHTIPLNLGALFGISDFRNILPDFEITEGGSIIPASSFQNSTIGGIFPGGLQQEWFTRKSSIYNYSFRSVRNAQTGVLVTGLNARTITLTIGGKTLNPYTVSESATSNSIIFRRLNQPPVQSDYITFNAVFGEDAVLHVSGYHDKTVRMFINGSYSMNEDISLTPN